MTQTISNGDGQCDKVDAKKTSKEVHHGSNTKEEDLNENDKTSSSDSFSAVRKLAGQIVEHPVFVIGMIVLILINAVMMGLATFQFVKSNAEVSAIFESIDLALLIIFTIEISLQFCYIGFGIFCDGWLFFDFFVVALSWIMAGFGNDSVKIFRSFRIFRALRLINRVEVLRNLVNAIISVIPRMGAICVLLSIVFYIFGVMFTMLFKDAGDVVELGDNYFGGLHLTLFTLFQVMTMDNWVDVTREIMVYKYWAWAPFCTFVFISGFIVVNLLIAVICDAVYELNDFAEAITGQLPSDDDKSTDEEGGKFAQRKILQESVFELTDQVQKLIGDQKTTLEALNHLTNELVEYDDDFRQEETDSSLPD